MNNNMIRFVMKAEEYEDKQYKRHEERIKGR
jgi:hypothetical protein